MKIDSIWHGKFWTGDLERPQARSLGLLQENAGTEIRLTAAERRRRRISRISAWRPNRRFHKG